MSSVAGGFDAILEQLSALRSHTVSLEEENARMQARIEVLELALRKLASNALSVIPEPMPQQKNVLADSFVL